MTNQMSPETQAHAKRLRAEQLWAAKYEGNDAYLNSTPREENPYQRPGDRKAWFSGWDLAESVHDHMEREIEARRTQ